MANVRVPLGRMSPSGAKKNDTAYDSAAPSVLSVEAPNPMPSTVNTEGSNGDGPLTNEGTGIMTVGSSSSIENGERQSTGGGSVVMDPLAPVISEREMHVVASIEEWNRGLTSGATLRKFRLLGQSPISFFSGTNHLFWADLSGDPHLTKFGNSKTTTWICGNCTYLAFSAFGSDAEGPLYGLDSFEESLVADYQYDVWRLAVSIALLVRERIRHFGQDKGGEGSLTLENLEELQATAVKAMARGYLAAVKAFRTSDDKPDQKPATPTSDHQGRAKKNILTSSGSGEGNAGKLSRLLAMTGGDTKGMLVRFLGVVERDLSRRKLIKKWCGEVSSSDVGSKASFIAKEGAVEACPQYEADAVVSALSSQYADGVNVKALARRLNVSAASCGLPRFVALTEGEEKELHILDICMQQKPTAYHFMNPAERSSYLAQYRNEAQRYAAACHALSVHDQRSTSWVFLEGVGVHPSAWGSYSVRDCSPFCEQYPVSVQDEAAVKSKMRAFALTSRDSLLELAEVWGRILGTQHSHAASVLEEQQGLPLEAGQQPVFSKEVMALAKGQERAFVDLASQIAVAYSRQVLHDWQVFLRHVLSRE